MTRLLAELDAFDRHVAGAAASQPGLYEAWRQFYGPRREFLAATAAAPAGARIPALGQTVGQFRREAGDMARAALRALTRARVAGEVGAGFFSVDCQQLEDGVNRLGAAFRSLNSDFFTALGAQLVALDLFNAWAASYVNFLKFEEAAHKEVRDSVVFCLASFYDQFVEHEKSLVGWREKYAQVTKRAPSAPFQTHDDPRTPLDPPRGAVGELTGFLKAAAVVGIVGGALYAFAPAIRNATTSSTMSGRLTGRRGT